MYSGCQLSERMPVYMFLHVYVCMCVYGTLCVCVYFCVECTCTHRFVSDNKSDLSLTAKAAQSAVTLLKDYTR